MTQTKLEATPKGQLQKTQRVSIPVRLEIEHHAELTETAAEEQRSMSFITLRRYLKGREIELSEQKQ